MKKAGIGIAVLLVLFLVIGFFLPSEQTVKRSIEINRPPAQVFQQVNELQNWNNWSAWYKMEPSAEWVFAEDSEGQDAWYTWKGEEIGSGKVTLVEVDAPNSISTKIEFEGEDPAQGQWQFEEIESGTKVQWSFYAKMGMMPHKRWMGLLMGTFLGPQLEQGLADMKAHVEELPELPSIEVSEVSKTPQPAITIRKTAPKAEIDDAIALMYGELMLKIVAADLEMDGPPYVVYYSRGDEIDLECGIPVKTGQAMPGDVELKETPAGTFYQAIHKGSYGTLQETHDGIKNWAAALDKEVGQPPVEWYINDPQEVEEDDVVTEVSYPKN